MTDKETTRTIAGIFGNIISVILFLSPLPSFYQITKSKDVQSFKPDPYIATLLNCAIWVFYGLPFVHPHSILVLTINSIGVVIELILITVFFTYAPWRKRRKILIALFVELVFVVVVVLITLLCLHGAHDRSMLVGIISVVLNTLMYIAPLTVMRRVIRTKSVRFMPLYLSIFNLVNGAIWFAYAFIKFDVYVLIPNALGVISGVVQLILYATFYRTTNWNDESSNRPEVELQRANPANQV